MKMKGKLTYLSCPDCKSKDIAYSKTGLTKYPILGVNRYCRKCNQQGNYKTFMRNGVDNG